MLCRLGGVYAYDHNSIPRRDSDPATPESIAALTMGATASSSHQLIVPGPSQGIPVPSEISVLIKFLLFVLSPGDMLMFGDGRLMPILTFCLLYAVYNWVDSDERIITFEETQGILCILYGEKQADVFRIAPEEVYYRLFVKLDDNSERTSVVLEGLRHTLREPLKNLGRLLFDQLLEDPAAKLRDEHLRDL